MLHVSDAGMPGESLTGSIPAASIGVLEPTRQGPDFGASLQDFQPLGQRAALAPKPVPLVRVLSTELPVQSLRGIDVGGCGAAWRMLELSVVRSNSRGVGERMLEDVQRVVRLGVQREPVARSAVVDGDAEPVVAAVPPEGYCDAVCLALCQFLVHGSSFAHRGG